MYGVSQKRASYISNMAKRVDFSSVKDREKSKKKIQAVTKCIERGVLNPLNIMPSLTIFHEEEDESLRENGLGRVEKKSESCTELWNSLSPVGVCTGKMAVNKLKKSQWSWKLPEKGQEERGKVIGGANVT